MSEATIAAKVPNVMELEAGTYCWCACGKSANQPFCDGSHKGSEFTPHELVISEKRKVALCQCKHTNTPPFCDGSHKAL